MSNVLLVFAKVPRPGEVKTRLTPFLTPREATQLYSAFLHDALHQYTRLDVDVRLYLAPPIPEDGLPTLPADVTVHRQCGETLGGRMQRAFDDAFCDEYDRAVIIGTDHPTLPQSFVRRAFSVLGGGASVCIGPSDDGGYYLLGMNDYYPTLFESMSYSHAQVFSDTLSRVKTTDAAVTILPQWYDVDTPGDLRRMLDDLRTSSGTAPKTRAAVDDLELRTLAQ